MFLTSGPRPSKVRKHSPMRKNSVIAKTIYAKQTKWLGYLFALDLARLIGKNPIVIAVQGTPQSGKTTFIKGMASGFGVNDEEISPRSLGVINRYPLKNAMFIYIDTSRLQKLDALIKEIKEIFKEQNAIIAVEGPERIRKLLPGTTIWLDIVDLKATERALILYPQLDTPIPEAFETLRRLGA